MVVLVFKWGFFERFEYNMKMIIYKINYWWLLYIKILDLVCLVLIRFDLLIMNDYKYFLFYIYNFGFNGNYVLFKNVKVLFIYW